jgi:anti-sigma B factor antagonist
MSSVERPRRSPQSAPAAKVERFEDDGVRVVVVVGELDISNVDALEDAAFDLPNEGLGIVLDLTGASYIDSATLGLLFKLQRGVQRRGQMLRVVCPPGSNAERVLELTGFTHELACDRDRNEAVAAIRRDVPLHE